jgi:N-acetyl-gamma-glutamyl-phosphate reductase common form
MNTLPVIVLGGSGYVAGEMLRIVAGHPALELAAAVSTSAAGERIGAHFGHLRTIWPDATFTDIDTAEQLLARAPHSILLSAAPHGASAPLIARFLAVADGAGARLTVADASADFRFTDPVAFEAVYGFAHPNAELIDQFICAVPEHVRDDHGKSHAAHPGCFATTMLLGIVPLLAEGLIENSVCVSAVTGSTGAGRKPRPTTHHPERQSNLFAYQALKHRHSPEVAALTEAATGKALDLHFVPHSGPFARGIHATIFAPMQSSVSTADVREALDAWYRDAPLVHVLDELPRMKDVAGSSYAALGAAVDGDTIVVTSVLDNLLKGAAGGVVQWLNRLLGLPETTGLTQPAIGWL